jgi:hypothetical protein
MLSETNRIRGVGLPSEIRALISDSLLHGAKAGIKDFSEVMAGVVEWKIQGHPCGFITHQYVSSADDSQGRTQPRPRVPAAS